ncbi:hypothetical protein ACFL6S_11330 [Candidatus Poribacteria bacterium]
MTSGNRDGGCFCKRNFDAAKAQHAKRDPYGGNPDISFGKTGFFRLEKTDRWWLVTSEGNAFLSFGINHYHWGWWAAGYNRDHWLREFGGDRPGDASWVKGFREAAAGDLARLGLNTLGVHSDPPVLMDPKPIAPYIAKFDPVDIPHWKQPGPEEFVDIFSPEFEARCDSMARELVEPRALDPFLVGFAMTDCPVLTDHDARMREQTIYGAARPDLPTWPRVLRNLGANAPGKQAYVENMRVLYQDDVAAFNTAYGTDFASWDALAAARDWRMETDFGNGHELRDNTEFLRRCVDQYYRIAKDALRRYDANHLFFGDKINANTDTLDTILDITSRHTDLVFYQAYGRYRMQKEILDRWTTLVDMPFLNGDSTFAVATEMMPRPYGPLAANQAERAAWTREFAESAFARPDFVGWHICGIIDTWKTLPHKEEHQHSGLMTPMGKFYPKMEQAIQELSRRLYQIALGE